MAALPEFTPDCSQCAALCCVALAFDQGDDFGFDKPAGLPCPHLKRHDCTIYEGLEDEGFFGCAQFDCQGAGQRAVALHGGTSWRDDVSVLVPMMESFRHLRTIHELVELLNLASLLPLEAMEEARQDRFLTELCPEEMTPERAEEIATGTLPKQVRNFLSDLSHHV